MLPAPPVPSKANGSLFEGRGSVFYDESTSGQGSVGLVDEVMDDLAHPDDFDVTWVFDVDVFVQECLQQASVVNGADDETADTTDPSKGGTIDIPSVPAGRVDSAANTASTTDQGRDVGLPAVMSRRAARA